MVKRNIVNLNLETVNQSSVETKIKNAIIESNKKGIAEPTLLDVAYVSGLRTRTVSNYYGI